MMGNGIVECTLLRDLGSLKRGDVVRYDTVKANGFERRGIVALGRVELEPEASDEPKRRRRRKQAEEPDVFDLSADFEELVNG